MDDACGKIICTWDDEANCVDCTMRSKLGCRLDMREFTFFIVNQIPSLVLACFGLALVGAATGAWWPLVVFVVACIILWGLGLETRVLCSHCPYWAEDGKTLRCWALTGSPKIWKYRPGPMNRVEKATILGFFSFLVAFPVLAEAYGVWFMARDPVQFGMFAVWGMAGIAVATLLAGGQFFYILNHHYCTRCVNFSCPLNRVPKPMVDAYLRRNRVMRDAWEESGYRLDDTT
jgi:hypothetical protein